MQTIRDGIHPPQFGRMLLHYVFIQNQLFNCAEVVHIGSVFGVGRVICYGILVAVAVVGMMVNAANRSHIQHKPCIVQCYVVC